MTLPQLQKLIAKKKLNGYIITRNNMFLGQDILLEENLIHKLTGFSGSAGTLFVTPVKAYLFVDGRYELQAARETNPHDVIVICQTKDTLSSWLKVEPYAYHHMGYNPQCFSIKEFDLLSRENPHIKLIAEELEESRLSPETFEVFEHNIEFAGLSVDEKISIFLVELKKRYLNAFFIGAADSVSWLFNLRSHCLPDTPILRAMAIIDIEGNIALFADNLDFKKVSSKLDIYPLNKLDKYLSKYRNQKLGYDKNFTSQQIALIADKHNINMISGIDPCQSFKSVKNPVELQGIRAAHLRDGVAVSKFIYWLEQNWQNSSELDIVTKLKEFRQQQNNFFSDSFDTIAGFGPNGAIVHYRPQVSTNLKLAEGNLLLLDSGAQYYDGTTDITRTIAIGTPNAEMIDNFTYVLKAHIALSQAIFPENISGRNLDAIARNELWQQGHVYNHGTGHGVGCFLNVHEGPIGISSKYSDAKLQSGMITSIEPGYYKEDHYGIRIENLVEIAGAIYPEMLQFKNLTLAPIDKRLINKYLLTIREIEWLNNYHQDVYDKIENYLETDEKNWLKDACSPL